MPAPINTDLSTVLSAVKSKLIADSLFADNTCFLSLAEDALEYPPSDQFCVIAPTTQQVDDPVRIGAGRVVLLVHGGMTLTLYSRLALDQVPRDDSWLTDSTLGSLQVLKCVINSLEQYQPLDGSSNQILPIGFLLNTVNFLPTKKDDGVHWGAIRTQWKYEWTVDLSC